MAIKILTKNSIDNTNIDGARANHFSAGMRSGIVKGAFNEGILFTPASNKIALETCELRISGHQVLIDSATEIEMQNAPVEPTKMSVIAEIKVDDSGVPDFRLFVQNSNVSLLQNNLFKTSNGKGTYQLRICNFTLGTTGLVSDIVRTADIITGGGESGVADIKFNATATQLSSSSQPDVNIDFNEETGEYDMHLGIPAGSGSRVTIGGVEQPVWEADFVENEIKKNKNLLNNDDFELGDITNSGKNLSNSTQHIRTKHFIKVEPNTQYTISINNGTAIDGGIKFYTAENMSTGSTPLGVFSSFPVTFTTGSNTQYVKLVLKFNTADLSKLNNKEVQLEKGSIVTAFEKYYGDIARQDDIYFDEKVELVFDKTTKYIFNGTAYTGGIQGGVTVSGFDLSKYSALRITYHFNNQIAIDYMPLTHAVNVRVEDGFKYAKGTIASATDTPANAHCYAITLVSDDKTQLKLAQIGFVKDGTANTRENVTYWAITRIEGVVL